jgi:DNA adenine methylase
MRAVAGFGLSYGGKYFAGYSQKWSGDSGRDYLEEFRGSVEKIKPVIQQPGVVFENKPYTEFHPRNMVIYCDPPYKNTARYSTGEFNSEEFWDIMRKWSKHNCVFISEESAPKDFKVVWRRQKRRTINAKQKYKYEKLFMYNN